MNVKLIPHNEVLCMIGLLSDHLTVNPFSAFTGQVVNIFTISKVTKVISHIGKHSRSVSLAFEVM
nr:hypothetical protein [Bacillus sp. UNC41MFS5]